MTGPQIPAPAAPPGGAPPPPQPGRGTRPAGDRAEHSAAPAGISKEHNWEYGREHNGYAHRGIPPACMACAEDRAARAHPLAEETGTT